VNVSSGNAVRGNSHSSENRASGVLGYNDGGGWGVYGYSTTGSAGVFGWGGKNGVLGQTSSANDSGVHGRNDGSGYGVSGYSTTGFAGVFGWGGQNGVYGQTNNKDASGVFGANDGGGWGVYGYSPQGYAGVYGYSGKNGVFGLTSSATDSGVIGRNEGSGWGVFGYSVNGTGVFGASQKGLAADFAGRTRTKVLEITGGSDFSESFDINPPEETAPASEPTTLRPGLVVSIDPAAPGRLTLTTQAYDRRVAGVISGAGGVKPGMVMSQEGTLADGKYPVALGGRVYCWADASRGAIEPGDLLTSSGAAGHAMKVTDAAKAQGAIIGKAMTGLKEGKGLVLVLITLQ
jgi:hypothetical protein